LISATVLQEIEDGGLKCPVCKNLLLEGRLTKYVDQKAGRNGELQTVKEYQCVRCQTRILVPIKEAWEI